MQKRNIFHQPTNLSVPQILSLQKYSMCIYSYLGKRANMLKLSTLMLQFKVPTNRKSRRTQSSICLCKKEKLVSMVRKQTICRAWLHSLSGHIITLNRSASTLPEVENVLWQTQLRFSWRTPWFQSCFFSDYLELLSSGSYPQQHAPMHIQEELQKIPEKPSRVKQRQW